MKLLPRHIKELKNLKAGKGRIYLMYKILQSKKEMRKDELFCKVKEIGREEKITGSVLSAYTILRLLNVAEDDGHIMRYCNVKFMNAYSREQLDRVISAVTEEMEMASTLSGALFV